MTVDQWLRILDGLFPPALAESWDNVGLQVGDRSWEAGRVLVALDPTGGVIGEAVEAGCGLLVTHHPLPFRPLERLDLNETTGRALAGAGVIGQYTHCSFRVGGIGTFLPSERANPVIGERGSLTEVEEDRLEMVLPATRLEAAVQALRAAHPYEEVAYDVYALVARDGLGPGRVTEANGDLTAADLADRCAERLGGAVRTARTLDRPTGRVALCGGAGGFPLPRPPSPPGRGFF